MLNSHIVIPTDLYNAIVCGLSVAACWQLMTILDGVWKRVRSKRSSSSDQG